MTPVGVRDYVIVMKSIYRAQGISKGLVSIVDAIGKVS